MKHRILFPAAAVLASLVFLTRNGADARPDVVSAASLTVNITGITPTAAVANYSADKYDYGTRTLCYDPAPAVAKNNCTTKTASGNKGTFNIAGLTPGTAYNYSIKAVDTKGGEKPYTTSGSFTTTKSTSLTADPAGIKARSSQVGIPAFDLTGRNLPKVERRAVKVFRTGS